MINWPKERTVKCQIRSSLANGAYKLTKNTDMYTHETIIAHNGIYGSPHERHVTIRLFTSHVLLSRLIGGVQRPPATIAIVEEKLRYCRQ